MTFNSTPTAPTAADAAALSPAASVGEILSLLAAYQEQSSSRLHLVPSENRLSLAARVPFLTEAVHRYSFPGPEPENWAWPGNPTLARIEAAATSGLRALFRAQHANLKAISGVNCLTIALSALTHPGDTVLSISEADGGHGSTRFIGSRLGLQMADLPFDRGQYAIDTDRLAAQIRSRPRPTLVYLDAFMCLFPHDLVALRAAVGPDVLIHYDGSHALGLIAAGQFQDPLGEGADSLGGSTHKTFPGPHKGVLLTNHPGLAARFDEHASHFVSHHHPADVASLAVAIAEMRDRGLQYAQRAVGDARHLAACLAERGFRVCAKSRGYTRSHQLWVDIAPVMPSERASQLLLHSGIVVNAIDIPYTSSGTGLRLGVQEAAWMGMGPDAMEKIAGVFAAVLLNRQHPSAAAERVRALIREHQDSGGAGDELLRMMLASVGSESRA